eukprot:UC1_evm2s1491
MSAAVATSLNMVVLIVVLLSAINVVDFVGANSTAYWLSRRAELIDSVYGMGPGVLPTRAQPDWVIEYPSDPTPGLVGLVWNLSSTFFPINATVFYSPVVPGKRSKHAFLFHHGHSNCICNREAGEPPIAAALCRPGCNSSMPTYAEIDMPGYSWWDLYNVSSFVHDLGYDLFVLSMPLKGVNLGPGASDDGFPTDHWWFLQWEQKGDYPLRYFLEPAVLTVNYAKALGYDEIYMAGLSGGGWSTTFAPAIDKRIKASFPIAGSVPCAMRNPDGLFPNQTWTGNDHEDFEQNCSPNPNPKVPEHPGRPAFQACNYTCQYLLAGLEPDRFQVQILHEYDTCCFSPHTRHDQMLAYEHNIRTELLAQQQQQQGKAVASRDNVTNIISHGWFTSTANNHTKHEVGPQDKAIIRAALLAASAAVADGPSSATTTNSSSIPPGSPAWDDFPCDILHQSLPAHCPVDVEPGLPPNGRT